MFVLNEELADWEAELPSLTGVPRLLRLLSVAWHLRQRDHGRAQLLLAEAESLLVLLDTDGARLAPDRLLPVIRARMTLIGAESAWLMGSLDAAQAAASQSLQAFRGAGDAIGCADAHWLLAWTALDRGDCPLGDSHLDRAAAAARGASDELRADVADAAAATFAVIRDLPSADTRWGRRFEVPLAQLHPLAAGWVSDFFGVRAFQASDFGAAVGHLALAYERALASGQLRRAINIAANIGNALTSLNSHDAALEWMQRGLELARPTGWPMSIGLCLLQTAETLRHLGQRDAAQELLSEARRLLAPFPYTRAYALALEYQGDLALDRADPAAALASFTEFEECGAKLGQTDFRSGARRGQAHALSQLGRPAEALSAAAAALQLARDHGDAYNQIAALAVLADIHTRHALPRPGSDAAPWPALSPAPPPEPPPGSVSSTEPPPGSASSPASLSAPASFADDVPTAAPSAALHYLETALALAAGIAGYTVPCALLDAAAREYARVGDYGRAYAAAQNANAARDQAHSRVATNRAVVMRLQHQTELAHSEGEHHRQLAAAEAQRAEVLQQTSATLAHLSAIGQEITAHLDATAVFRALDRHVHGLLDATHFSVFLIEADEHTGERQLRRAFGVEAGKRLPATRLALDQIARNTVRCVIERREIQIDVPPQAATPNHTPGTLATRSLLFVPLLIGERVLGVMTVQSLHAWAYGERERLIFRTLCAYGAIALDNAAAYRQVAATLKALNATQAQLLEKNIELEQAYRSLEQVSLTDQLTGLRNRRFFLQHVDADVALCLRLHEDARFDGEVEFNNAPGRDLVFFMVDLDHFKQVNDRHGHAAGDAVLIQMQERLREVFRESDYLVRWGGEEFLVMARATQRDDAGALAERMRRAVAERPFLLPDGAALANTCSIGYACYPFLPAQPRLLSWVQVMELADQALYIAKKGGRNAWAALVSTATTRPEGLFERMLHELERTLQENDAMLLHSRADGVTGRPAPGGDTAAFQWAL